MLLVGTIILSAFSFVGWVVLLGGVAALNAKFQEVNDLADDIGFDGGRLAIQDILGLAWWMTCFHLFLIIALIVCAAMRLLVKYSTSLGHFFAALFALQMTEAHRAAEFSRSFDDLDGSSTFSDLKSRANAFLAGCIMVSLATAAVLVWIGVLVPHDHLPGRKTTPNQGKPFGVPSQYATPAPPPPAYSATTGTGASHGSASAPSVPPPPMGHPQAPQAGYNVPPPAAAGPPPHPGAPTPPGGPLPPAGATHYSAY